MGHSDQTEDAESEGEVSDESSGSIVESTQENTKVLERFKFVWIDFIVFSLPGFEGLVMVPLQNWRPPDRSMNMRYSTRPKCSTYPFKYCISH